MSAWTAFGFGFLVGAIVFDQLWRYVNRLGDRAAKLRAETALLASGMSAGTAETHSGSGPKDRQPGPNGETPNA
jgi:hypothetical protein